jgi:hypothetical protein
MGKRKLTKGSKDIKKKAGEGRFLSTAEGTPRILNDVSNQKPKPTHPKDILSEDEWCAYGGLPSPKAYM